MKTSLLILKCATPSAKRLLEKRAQKNSPPPTEYYEEEEDFDPYQEYEAELERQRAELERTLSPPKQAEVPPPLPTILEQEPTPVVQPTYVPSTPVQPKRPTLSAEEKAALKNLQLSSRSRRKSSGSTKSRLKKHLSSPTAAREALLLAEVLGPPKAFKSGE